MKRLIFALAMLPGAALAQNDEWKPNCPDFNAVINGSAVLSDDETPKLRLAHFMGVFEGYNLALATSEREVMWQEIMVICQTDPSTEFIAALRGAMLSNRIRP